MRPRGEHGYMDVRQSQGRVATRDVNVCVIS